MEKKIFDALSLILRITICLAISIYSFAIYYEGVWEFSWTIAQAYKAFLLDDDPIFIFRSIHIIMMSPLASKLPIRWPCTQVSCILENISRYYQWLYLFTTIPEYVFESLISAITIGDCSDQDHEISID